MIARLWRGAAKTENARAYEAHLRDRVFPSLGDLAGHEGAFLLRRETPGQVEFLALTLWDSLASIEGFAGAQIEAAVVEPEARALLAEFDDVVRHYEVAHRANCVIVKV